MNKNKRLSMLLAIALVATLLPLPATRAAEVAFYFRGTNDFTLNDGISNLSELEIVDYEGSLFSVENGLSISLDDFSRLLFERTVTSVIATGSAVTLGRVSPNPQVTYSNNLKTVHIPIRESFQKNEVVTISGLKVRVYKTSTQIKPVYLDYTGDGIKDVQQDSGTRVRDVSPVPEDRLVPYAIENAQAVYTPTPKSVTLTWDLPIDPDVERLIIKRFKGQVDGATALLEKQWNVSTEVTSEVDTSIEENQTYAYQFIAEDRELASPITQVEVTTSVTPPASTTTTTEPPPSTTTPPETTAPPVQTPPEEEEPPSGPPFSDTPENEWYTPYATALVSKNALMAGGMAYPGNDTTRGELALWLAKASGSYRTTAKDAGFTDMSRVSREQFHAVNSLVEDGVIQGYADKTYRPSQTVNRVEAAKILRRGLGLKSVNKPSPFTDVPLSEWYSEDVRSLYWLSVVDGQGGTGTYGVNQPITHAAAWKMITLSLIADKRNTQRENSGLTYFANKTPEQITQMLLNE